MNDIVVKTDRMQNGSMVIQTSQTRVLLNALPVATVGDDVSCALHGLSTLVDEMLKDRTFICKKSFEEKKP